jgi:hypothetical protein
LKIGEQLCGLQFSTSKRTKRRPNGLRFVRFVLPSCHGHRLKSLGLNLLTATFK